MTMQTLRAMLKIHTLKVEIKLADRTHRLTVNRSQFLKDTVSIPADTDINVTNRCDGLVIHSNYSLIGEVISSCTS